MGEAKRRAQAEEFNWFHGTSERFEQWRCPPPVENYGNIPHHTFVSFTKKIEDGRKHRKGDNGNVCKITIREDAKILDLMSSSKDGPNSWRSLCQHPLALRFEVPNNYSDYLKKCQDGSILRPVINGENNEENDQLSRDTAIAQGYGMFTQEERETARINVMTMKRAWIEAVLAFGLENYSAVKCAERSQVAKMQIRNLYIRDLRIIDRSDWVQ